MADGVKVGDKTAEFKLSSGAGESSATFAGYIPSGGNELDVQYPCDTPDITSQKYSSTEALPHDKMLLTATGCELSEDPTFTLSARYAALQLNLYGSKAIGSIVVTTEETPAKTYTLDRMGTGSGTCGLLYQWGHHDDRWNSGTGVPPSKASNDPCPSGWRVPTVDELGSLCFIDWNSTTHEGKEMEFFLLRCIFF